MQSTDRRDFTKEWAVKRPRRIRLNIILVLCFVGLFVAAATQLGLSIAVVVFLLFMIWAFLRDPRIHLGFPAFVFHINLLLLFGAVCLFASMVPPARVILVGSSVLVFIFIFTMNGGGEVMHFAVQSVTSD